jgi:hypothetical protein
MTRILIALLLLVTPAQAFPPSHPSTWTEVSLRAEQMNPQAFTEYRRRKYSTQFYRKTIEPLMRKAACDLHQMADWYCAGKDHP